MTIANFFLCQNPFASYPSIVETNIYHNTSPKFFGSVLAIDPAGPIPQIHYQGDNEPFLYMHPDGRQKLYIILLGKVSQQPSHKLRNAMQIAAHWFCACINTNDTVHKGKGSAWNLLQDVNILTPGLKILEFTEHKTFLLCYPQGIKTFPTSTEMDQFITTSLDYPPALLTNRIINPIEPTGELIIG
jgi:hypothetical protein